MSSIPRFRTNTLARAVQALAAAAVLAAFAAVPGRAQAGAIPLSIEEMTAIADDVVAVEVVETSSRLWEGRIVTDVQLQVLENFKGDMAGTQTITQPGGRWNEFVQIAPNLPTFSEGERAILFLSRPFERLSDKDQEGFNKESPLVQSPQAVGGRQGKLRIERTSGYATAGWDKSDGVDAAAKVSASQGSASPQAPADAPSYGQVAGALHELSATQKALEGTKSSLRQIPGVYGVFSVPERTNNAVLRAFDPLPQMAYYDDEQLDALRRSIEAQYQQDVSQGAQ